MALRLLDHAAAQRQHHPSQLLGPLAGGAHLREADADIGMHVADQHVVARHTFAQHGACAGDCRTALLEQWQRNTHRRPREASVGIAFWLMSKVTK